MIIEIEIALSFLCSVSNFSDNKYNTSTQENIQYSVSAETVTLSVKGKITVNMIWFGCWLFCCLTVRK